MQAGADAVRKAQREKAVPWPGRAGTESEKCASRCAIKDRAGPWQERRQECFEDQQGTKKFAEVGADDHPGNCGGQDNARPERGAESEKRTWAQFWRPGRSWQKRRQGQWVEGQQEANKQNLHGMRQTGPGLPNLGQMLSKGQGRALQCIAEVGAGLETRRKPNEMRHGVGPCRSGAKCSARGTAGPWQRRWQPMHCKEGPGWRPA